MGVLDNLIDYTTALGKGVYSVGEDLVGGFGRTAEGLGVDGSKRMLQIDTENKLLLGLLHDAISNRETISKLVEIILREYYGHFPEHALKMLEKTAAMGTGYVAGRLILGAAIAKAVAKKIAEQIIKSVAFKQLATKLGISAGAGATWIGLPISMLMFQGVAQRSSAASRRLQSKLPALYQKLRAERGLDMLYFLVEKPLEKQLQALWLFQQNPRQFEREFKEIYEPKIR